MLKTWDKLSPRQQGRLMQKARAIAFTECNKQNKGLTSSAARFYLVAGLVASLLLLLLVFAFAERGEAAETWLITAYCSCKACCNKADGITASGLPAQAGTCALNWLPFGTKVDIQGLGIYTVQDRGARSLFGSKHNHIKHIDIWFASHRQARKFGKQYREVTILKEGK